MIILGAGMTGCLAGVLNPTARIHEANASIMDDHRAVLRFRSDAVSKQTGIPFKKVRVYKSIWYDKKDQVCTPRLANMYSQKVIGTYASRSIWNLEPVDRWVAPHNFHQLLAERCNIEFDSQVTSIMPWDQPIISTLPMYVLAKMLDYQPIPEFNFRSIYVTRYEVKDCDVYQTIYFPDPRIPLYRATLTGNNLILENVCNSYFQLELARIAFGIENAVIKEIDSIHEQRHGKISPINDEWRKEFILRATIDHGVFSLGRYATWRNILIDDVLEDIYVIRRLIEQSHYNLTLEMSK